VSRPSPPLALSLIGLFSLLWLSDAYATNGYFSSAYSVKSEGMAGTAIAFPQDSLTIATNPAGLLSVGDTFDVGFDGFQPDRDATLVQGGQSQSFDGNSTRTFVIPSFGYVHQLSSTLAAGVALFGNGRWTRTTHPTHSHASVLPAPRVWISSSCSFRRLSRGP